MLEEKALVIALRDTFLPRMIGRDASVFVTLVMDVWPNVDIPMVFGGEEELGEKLPENQSRISSKCSSRSRIRTAKSQSSTKSVKGKVAGFFFSLFIMVFGLNLNQGNKVDKFDRLL